MTWVEIRSAGNKRSREESGVNVEGRCWCVVDMILAVVYVGERKGKTKSKNAETKAAVT